MRFANHFTISNCKCADELIKLDWPENLIISPEDCKIYLEYCKKHDMKFLKDSYGTIVHKTFNRYFEHISSRNDEEYELEQKLTCKKGLDGNYTVEGVDLDLDHTNLFKSKIYEDVYMVTSSPYGLLDKTTLGNLKDYPYTSWVINPNFLDYHGFIMRLDIDCIRHPLWDVNYAFTNATDEQMMEIEKTIHNDIDVFPVFIKIPR